ncbi:unnamed protein product [Dovyalis caffra]|uniref:Uncharacterized protein n=1 Tax=Dovyalis caffra TaxID=77055 RepID=A0AAV1QY74_9ROSI|nr:unnamed protein product [Dovyalis caffra]
MASRPFRISIEVIALTTDAFGGTVELKSELKQNDRKEIDTSSTIHLDTLPRFLVFDTTTLFRDRLKDLGPPYPMMSIAISITLKEIRDPRYVPSLVRIIPFAALDLRD